MVRADIPDHLFTARRQAIRKCENLSRGRVSPDQAQPTAIFKRGSNGQIGLCLSYLASAVTNGPSSRVSAYFGGLIIPQLSRNDGDLVRLSSRFW